MIALNRLQTFIKQHALFQEKDRVLLAVSGGRDSVLMARLFKSAGFNFGIAHCNFQLRTEEADKDEQFTAELASELGVEFFATRFDTAEYASENHISIQMAARDLRYQWLEKIRQEFDYQYIGLAHHQNDVIETMLLNLTRGTGIAGLHGILAKKGKLIRPLLFLSREEIDEMPPFEYREDSSNLSVKYARNKIRLEVIPVLKELNPSLEQTFEANRKRFAELEIFLELHVERLREQLFKKLDDHEFEIDLQALKNLIPLNTLLYGLFHPFGFTETVLNDLTRAWDGSPGKVFRSSGHQLILDRDRLILCLIDQSTPEDVSIGHESAEYIWNGQKFTSRVIAIDEFQLSKSAIIAQLDCDLLQFPLKLRTWKNGDQFQPLGLKSKKKLSDFFIEQKIRLNHKKDIGILENGNGDILWIAGLRISERFKISPNTKKVFILAQSI
ncbi:tRNA(Ile)-lysidine synthase [Daejeonella rubra]|uniref:tRNA(Ile)-lysidine synthase n=1 Tax=Daejeonella rubra TaxID=990371 RepID=A0A1G9Z4P1_9SPHI|nr:tRNA lysidine(34) synthetase TilS [Daejeonella rubra]SDN16478.1 tRNA(Ile)-lysidine synthase [Daejeonella rubra]